MVAAPAVRILVGDMLDAHQVADALDVLQNDLVGVPDLQTGELFARLGGQTAGLIHRHHNRQLGIMLGADLKVLDAVAGRGVDAAGAALQGDVIAQDDQAGAVQEGMLVLHALELGAGDAGLQDGVVLNAAGLHGGLDQVGCHDMVLVADLDEGILDGGVQAGGHVGGQGPGSGGPDDDPRLVQRDAVLCQHAVGVFGQLEADIDGVAGVLGVLDLGLSQGGVVLGAPVDSLHALVDVALLGHLAENFHLTGLKLGFEGQIGVIEVALDAQALELLVHHIDVLGGKLAADLAQLQLGDSGLLVAQGAQRLQLDGQAVGVIAGHIGGAVARHVLVADDDILDDLVQRGAHVDVAVGVRRAVVQNKAGFALVIFDHLLIDMVFLPVFQHLRFFFRQAGTHGKRRGRQMDGIIVILRQSSYTPLYFTRTLRPVGGSGGKAQDCFLFQAVSAVKIDAGKGIKGRGQFRLRLLFAAAPAGGCAAAAGRGTTAG